MPRVIQCPQCQRKLQIPDALAGRRLRCPACQAAIVLKPAAAIPVATPLKTEPAPPPPTAVSSKPVRPVRPAPPTDDDDVGDVEKHAPRPRPRRAGRSRRREKQSNLATWLIVGIVAAVFGFGVLAVGVIFVVVKLGSSANSAAVARRPIAPPEDQQQRQEEIAEAFRNPRPALNDKDEGKKPAAIIKSKEATSIPQELEPVFADMAQALAGGDVNRAGSHFDFDRLFDEMQSQYAIPQPILNDKKGFLAGMQSGFVGSLARNSNLRWSNTEIKHFKELAPGEVVIIARHQGVTVSSLKFRWWLTKRSGTWKFFDFEELNAGMRASSIFGCLAAEVGGNKNSPVLVAIQQLGAVGQAFSQPVPNLGVADANLQALAGVKLPPMMDAARWMFTASVHLHRGQNEAALAALDKCSAIRPDFPVVNLLRGIAHNNLGQYQIALTHLEKYRDLLGEDDDLRLHINNARAGMGK
jgi:hypothetical protein